MTLEELALDMILADYAWEHIVHVPFCEDTHRQILQAVIETSLAYYTKLGE